MSSDSLDYYKFFKIVTDIVRSYRERILVAARCPETIESWSKKDNVDFSTNFDVEIEDSIRTKLSQSFHDSGFFVEEGVSCNLNKEFVWYIDPIDGTKYFRAGLPGFTSSVGLLKNGNPVFGVVYDFALDIIYSAWEGQHTKRNDVEISVLSPDYKPESIQIVAERAHRYKNWEMDKDWVDRRLSGLSQRFYRERDLGLGALSCVMVAGGMMNMGAILTLTGQSGTKPVDIAAGRALIKYAGGKEKLISVSGLSFSSVLVAGASHVVDEIEKIIIE